MEDLETGGAPAETPGQATEAPQAGQPQGTQETPTGQAPSPEAGTPQTETPGVFDPETMSGTDVHKYWQGQYTRRSQELSDTRKQLDQWNQIQQNPWPVIQDYLNRAGYQVSRVDETPAPAKTDEYGNPVEAAPSAMDPKVLTQAVNQAVAPLQQQVMQMTTTQVVGELNAKFADWQEYETEIQANLKNYPGLAHDVDKLYLLSVPESVREAQYIKRAQARQNERKSLETVSAGTQVETVKPDEKPKKLDECWDHAMKKHGLR